MSVSFPCASVLSKDDLVSCFQSTLPSSQVEDAVFCAWKKKKPEDVKISTNTQQKLDVCRVSCNDIRDETAYATGLVAVLQACACRQDLNKGNQIHADISQHRLLENNMYLGAAVVDMYAKCGALAKAQKVFDELPVRNVVSWTALISGYTQHGHGEEAIILFDCMLPEGLSPNAFTLSSILKACGSMGASHRGQEIHAEIIRQGFLEKDLVLSTALVDMYVKCGFLTKAQELFDALPGKNAVSWTALITGYAQEGHSQEAVNLFEEMQAIGLSPDGFTFSCVLKACGNMGFQSKGTEMHAEIVRQGLFDADCALCNAVVDMYAKCGRVMNAQKVFDDLHIQDLACWNALIAGYAQLGKDAHVFNLFDSMIGEGKKPDFVTFTILLNACSHAGLMDKAQKYFETMIVCYSVNPSLFHFTCIADLYGRAGYLDKAFAVIRSIPFFADRPMWHIVMAACQNWGNVKMGTIAFDQAVEVDEKDAAVYVSLSNIYVSSGTAKELDQLVE